MLEASSSFQLRTASRTTATIPMQAPPDAMMPPASRALTPALVFLGMVVAIVSSLGAPMIPTIAVAYGVPVADAQWSLTITMLVGAIATPTMGRLGDGQHRRAVILAALAAVTLGGTLAAG